MRPIQRSYQQMQQFTADAAHELRTPIAAAQATVEAALGTAQLSEADTRETLLVLDRQHQRLAQLTQDLLLLTRLDLQGQDGQLCSCCLQDLISDIAEELIALARRKKLQLQTHILVKSPLWVAGNESHLYRLVFNLVMNALQHTPAGGRVTLSLDVQDQLAAIAIQDTGIGIAPEHQTRIFDRFYRVNSDRSRASGGSGLGLSIAQAIAQNHSGKILLESDPNQGSCFTVFLPTCVPP